MEQGLVEKERQNTPGISSDQQCDPVAHFNNAGCSLPSSQVVNALKAYLDLEAQIGGYVEINSLFQTSNQARIHRGGAIHMCVTATLLFFHTAQIRSSGKTLDRS